jgi:fucose permease
MILPFHRTRMTWLAYLMLAIYAYFLNIFGPITPYLKSELALSYTVSSLHFTAFAAGILGAGFASPRVVRYVGRIASLWIGAAGLSLGACFLLLGRTPLLTIGASFVMGLLGSMILAVVPGTLSDLHGEMRAVALSEANLLSSLLATLAPLVVGWAVLWSGQWRWALGITLIAPLLFMVLLGRHDAPGMARAASAMPSDAARHLPLRYWVYWVALTLAVAIEFCMIYWSADYLEKAVGLPRASAAQAVSVFLAAMIAGRWAGSRLVRRFAPRLVITVAVVVAGLGFLVFWLTASPGIALAGLFMTGLGVANLYPLLMSLAIGSAGSMTVEASSRATLASGAAILALPLVLGRIADSAGIQMAFVVVLVLIVAVFVVSQLAGNERMWAVEVRSEA